MNKERLQIEKRGCCFFIERCIHWSTLFEDSLVIHQQPFLLQPIMKLPYPLADNDEQTYWSIILRILDIALPIYRRYNYNNPILRNSPSPINNQNRMLIRSTFLFTRFSRIQSHPRLTKCSVRQSNLQLQQKQLLVIQICLSVR